MKNDARQINRREAIRTGLRLGGLGGVVALVAGVRWRNGGCGKANPCRRCPAFVDCGLPKAAQARGATEREVTHG